MPPSTRGGRPAEYCSDRTWGPEDRISCKKAGQAEQVLLAIQDSPALGEATLLEVREAISAVHDPVTRLSRALDQARAEVGARADAALAEAEQARVAATEAEGRAQAAQAETDAAQRAQQAAEKAQKEAEQRAEIAEEIATKARRDAAVEREASAVARGTAQRLEEETGYLRDDRDQAVHERNAALARAERAEAQHQATAEELDRFRAQQQTERGEWAAERTRLTEQLNRLSTDYAVRLDELQQAHTNAQERLARDHTAQLADLQRQAGRAEALAERISDLEGQLREEQKRDRDREQGVTEVRHGLEALLHQLREEPHTPQEHLVDLVVRTLWSAQTPEIRQAAEALLEIDDQVVGVCNMAVDQHDGLIPEGQLSTSVLNRLVRARLTEEEELRRVTALARSALPMATVIAAHKNRPQT